MKKKIKRAGIIMLCCLTFVGILSGCSSKANTEKAENKKTEPTEYQFDATVSEVAEDYIMVVALPDQTIVDEVKVWTGLLSGDNIQEIEVGTTVRITHDGKMTMSIPPQMSAVEIEIIEE